MEYDDLVFKTISSIGKIKGQKGFEWRVKSL